MKNDQEFHPGISPLEHVKRKQAAGEGGDIEKAREETTAGLLEAIEATKKRIAEYQTNNWDTSELQTRLESLEKRLEYARRK